MAFNWNGFSTADGSYDTYSRACITAFYGARLERDVALNGNADVWYPTVLDPADDAHSLIAAIGGHFSLDPRAALGGIGAIHERLMQVVNRYFGGFTWGYFAHPHAEITATSNVDGTDFKTRIGRAKAIEAMGAAVRRVVPLTIPDPTAGFDQFGRPATLGAKGYTTITSGPYAGGNRVVQWDGLSWIPVVPQLSARPDMVEAGDIAPETAPSLPADPDGSGYQDAMQQGDYMGIHLWTQARDVYNLCWKFFSSSGTFAENDPENDNLNQIGYALAGPRYFDRLRFPEPSIYANSAQRRVGIFGDNGPPGGTGWGFNVAGAETAWDATADIFGLYPEAHGSADANWSQRVVSGTNVQWIQYRIEMQGFESELLWTPVARHRKAKLTVWVYSSKAQGFAFVPQADVVYDDFGTGLTENRWNLVSEHVTDEDRTPTTDDKRIFYRTGDLIGLADPGEYALPEQPPDPSPPPPDPLSLAGAGAPTHTARGFVTGQFGSNSAGAYSNVYPSGIVDWSEGFDYLPA